MLVVELVSRKTKNCIKNINIHTGKNILVIQNASALNNLQSVKQINQLLHKLGTNMSCLISASQEIASALQMILALKSAKEVFAEILPE